MLDSSVWHRSSVGDLKSGSSCDDQMFSNIRYENDTLESATFTHCTFANVSFKESTLLNCVFTDCVFLNCYFRRATIEACTLTSSRLYECAFPRLRVLRCDFRYTSFIECFIDYDTIHKSMPEEPNLREDLSAGLALAASTSHEERQAKRFRLAAIKAHEEHLWFAVTGDSAWYKEHYSGMARVRALLGLIASKANGIAWGHGESLKRLARNAAIVVFAIIPLLLYLARAQFTGSNSLMDWQVVSLNYFLGDAGFSPADPESTVARLICAFGVLAGIVTFGLVITYLFRSITSR